MRNNNIFLAATASILFISACGSDTDTTSASATTDSIAVTAPDAPAGDDTTAPTTGSAAVGLKNSRFDPTELEIAAGEAVTFTNNDGYDHTITSKDDSSMAYDSGKFGEGETFEQTYDEPGTYNFFCQIHPTMRGSVIVS